MKATVLVENHSLFNKFYNAEHGYSAWLRTSILRYYMIQDIPIIYKNAIELE